MQADKLELIQLHSESVTLHEPHFEPTIRLLIVVVVMPSPLTHVPQPDTSILDTFSNECRRYSFKVLIMNACYLSPYALEKMGSAQARINSGGKLAESK